MARLTTLLFAMWLGVTVSTEVDLEKRIYRGQTCGATERQYHVKLISDNGTLESLCGGSLISDRWILTAAHCVKQGDKVTALLGVHPGPPKEVPITDSPKIFKDNRLEHDLMLLKLPAAVVGIKPVQLPDCQYRPEENDTVQVAGHASNTADPNNQRIPGPQDTLQCADLNIVDCQEFKNMFHDDYQARKHEHWMCYSAPGVDTCPGDSGGGVVYQCQIYGVHIRGHPTEVCGSPAVFMDLCHQPYLKWIQDTIKGSILDRVKNTIKNVKKSRANAASG